jgi:hypothetical protein
MVSARCLRRGSQLWWWSTGLCLALACSEDRGEGRLQQLSLEGIALTPPFSPEIGRYRAEVSLLMHTAILRAVADPGSTVSLAGTPGGGSGLSARRALDLGANEITLVVAGPHASSRHEYQISIERGDQLWRDVQVLVDAEPRADAYFGDYLRASSRWLYVNSSRRGLLYGKAGGRWTFDRRVEELFGVELAWMFEAAITDDTLALVAEPSGGVETLYTFSSAAGGAWTTSGEHTTGTQGTIRIAGSELAFVSSQGVRFFRREAGAWRLVQELPAPAVDIGFGERSTYFDAPGVSMSETALVVGAPLADTRAGDSGGDAGAACVETEVAPAAAEQATAGCLHDAGAAFVYERDASGTWRQATRLWATNAARDMQFGRSAALRGDLIAVGAAREGSVGAGFAATGAAYDCDPGAPVACAAESGAVYLFERAATGWQAAGTLKASHGRPHDYFGDAVLIAGDTLLVAAPGHDGAPGAGAADDSAPDSGGIFAFVRSAGTWSERGLHKLPRELAPPYPFPSAMLISGAALLVSSNIADHVTASGETLSHAGKVYYL